MNRSSTSPMLEVPQTSLLRRRMVEGGLLRVNSSIRRHMRSEFRLLLNLPQRDPLQYQEPPKIIFRSKRTISARQHHSEIITHWNLTPPSEESQSVENESTAEGSTEPGSWLPKKKHFRETEEWKTKRSRIITKMRCLGKINLAFIISRMPVTALSPSLRASEPAAV